MLRWPCYKFWLPIPLGCMQIFYCMCLPSNNQHHLASHWRRAKPKTFELFIALLFNLTVTYRSNKYMGSFLIIFYDQMFYIACFFGSLLTVRCPLDFIGCILNVHKVIVVFCVVDCPWRVINLQYTFLLIFRQSTIFACYCKIFYHRISLRSVLVLNGTMIVIKNSHKFFSSRF